MIRVRNDLMYVAGAIVIVIIAALIVLSGLGSQQPAAITTVAQNVTSTVPNVTTTIVKNITTATGPNLATCNGYNYSISEAFYSVVGSCNWRGGLMNASIFGGSFDGATLDLIEQNVTTTPFNESISADACMQSSSGAVYVPVGNYKVVFSVGGPAASSCGSTTMRLGRA